MKLLLDTGIDFTEFGLNIASPAFDAGVFFKMNVVEILHGRSKTRAGPLKASISLRMAAGLVTADWGARLPYSTARPPLVLKGLSKVLITSLSGE